MKITVAGVLTICVVLVTSITAKGATTKITIIDTVSGQEVDIADEGVLQNFNVWAGPGTFVDEVEGTQGFIIDWASGIVPRPDGSRRYEVRFYVHGSSSVDAQPAYVVFYERDPGSPRGFVYLPGRSDEQYRQNTRAIVRGHGFEGNWFRAAARWENAIQSLVPVP
jgi:hypothetical protein